MSSHFRWIATLAIALVSTTALAEKLELAAPPGSAAFGRAGAVLPNGNVVVVDPAYDPGGAGARRGAVHLYDAQGARISTLSGGAAGDEVGSGGVTVLASGSFVVRSPSWHAGAAAAAGAVTWVDGARGLSGVVSAANSLVGSRAEDRVGAVFALGDGGYVVVSRFWSNGGLAGAGAATRGRAVGGVVGEITTANSLVGMQAGDAIGSGGVVALASGAYVVKSPGWHNGDEDAVGAATWGGAAGVVGAASALNSLVGSNEGDEISGSGVFALPGGAYVVGSRYWDNGAAVDAGAVTFGRADGGVAGVVSAGNSLVGTHGDDQLGGTIVALLGSGHYVIGAPDWHDGALAVGAAVWCDGALGCAGALTRERALVGTHAGDAVGAAITALANGHYVVASPTWSHGAIAAAGAATWGDGTRGTVGVVSASNSLVGTTAGDRVGAGGVTALATGHYVVSSPYWSAPGQAGAGAATWGDGAGGTVGAVSTANSIVGGRAADHVGARVVPLARGDYVVASREWDDAATLDVGAVTWASGAGPTALAVSPLNSLVGTRAHDAIGTLGAVALDDGSYVVASPQWSNGGMPAAGAVTWGDAHGGVAGRVSSANSRVGLGAYDHVGQSVVALPDGDYVVATGDWDDYGAADAGAVSWIGGAAPTHGTLSSLEARIGSRPGDRIGAGGVHALPDGNYWFRSAGWDEPDHAAVTLGRARGGTVGAMREDDTVIGWDASDGIVLGYDTARARLAVGVPGGSRVVLLSLAGDAMFGAGFE